MERTLIAFNLPNVITIGLAAFVWYFVVALIMQYIIKPR
jgi:hypothetical protein